VKEYPPQRLNFNPRSSKLETILRDPEIEKYSKTKQFELRFYVASYAGYDLHEDCMRTYAEFQKLSEVKRRTQKEG
jgi:hypothetical protein